MRFIECVNTEKYVSKVTLELHSGPERRGTWGRKQEEFVADFLALAKRTLHEDDYRIFRYRFLLGADCNLIERKLNIDRGTYFNRVYIIMRKIGRACAELEPYALFPLSEYFHTSFRNERPKPAMPEQHEDTPVRPPLRKVRRIDLDLGVQPRPKAA